MSKSWKVMNGGIDIKDIFTDSFIESITYDAEYGFNLTSGYCDHEAGCTGWSMSDGLMTEDTITVVFSKDDDCAETYTLVWS